MPEDLDGEGVSHLGWNLSHGLGMVGFSETLFTRIRRLPQSLISLRGMCIPYSSRPFWMNRDGTQLDSDYSLSAVLFQFFPCLYGLFGWMVMDALAGITSRHNSWLGCDGRVLKRLCYSNSIQVRCGTRLFQR